MAAGSGRGAAARAGRVSLTAADFASARDRVLLGTRRASPLAPGAADDLASATALETQIVREFGLSDKIGPVSYSGTPAGYPALAGSRGYSEHTQWLVDQEVAAILAMAETRARDLLTSHREALDRLTAALRPGARSAASVPSGGARLQLIEGAGHHLPRRAPDAAADAMVAFLAATEEADNPVERRSFTFGGRRRVKAAVVLADPLALAGTADVYRGCG